MIFVIINKICVTIIININKMTIDTIKYSLKLISKINLYIGIALNMLFLLVIIKSLLYDNKHLGKPGDMTPLISVLFLIFTLFIFSQKYLINKFENYSVFAGVILVYCYLFYFTYVTNDNDSIKKT